MNFSPYMSTFSHEVFKSIWPVRSYGCLVRVDLGTYMNLTVEFPDQIISNSIGFSDEEMMAGPRSNVDFMMLKFDKVAKELYQKARQGIVMESFARASRELTTT